MKKQRILNTEIQRDEDGVAIIKNDKITCKVNDDMYHDLVHYTWCSDGSYAVTTINRKLVRMHVYVMEKIGVIPKDKVVDHINQDKYDNRTINLRIINKSSNVQNRKTTNRYGYKGVTMSKGKYTALITVKGEVRNLGWFTSPEIAGYAYNMAAVNVHGKGCEINNVPIPVGFFWNSELFKLLKCD